MRCVELFQFLSFLPGLESCEPLFDDLGVLFHEFCTYVLTVQPLQPISGPCSIEKHPSLQMANRYTRIFDAGGLFVVFFCFLTPATLAV